MHRPQIKLAALLSALIMLSMSCKMNCFAAKAEQLDSPLATTLNTALKAEAGSKEAKPGRFDHTVFDQLLRKHSRPDAGRIDYAGLKADGAQLQSYTEALAKADLGALSAQESKALLLNAYNAFTLKLILEHYPGLGSIKDLPSPWKGKRWVLAGSTVSLDDIEHGLLRPTFKDPRIHFAVNCASIGCPPLTDFAYQGAKLESQLELVATATLRNPRYASMREGELQLTKILSWYGDDFTAVGWAPRAESLPQFVQKYADMAVVEQIEKQGADTPVSFGDYDWRLNDIER